MPRQLLIPQQAQDEQLMPEAASDSPGVQMFLLVYEVPASWDNAPD